MFSLKFDLLFPSLEAARATAKKLNFALTGSKPKADPRDLKRMRDELDRAREDVRMQVTVNRNLFL
jgi:hypothetical protein